MKIYVVSAPSVLEVFLDYESADVFRNQCIVARYNEVTLVSRTIRASGSSLHQSRAGFGLKDPANSAMRNFDGEGTMDVALLSRIEPQGGGG